MKLQKNRSELQFIFSFLLPPPQPLCPSLCPFLIFTSSNRLWVLKLKSVEGRENYGKKWRRKPKWKQAEVHRVNECVCTLLFCTWWSRCSCSWTSNWTRRTHDWILLLLLLLLFWGVWCWSLVCYAWRHNSQEMKIKRIESVERWTVKWKKSKAIDRMHNNIVYCIASNVCDLDGK